MRAARSESGSNIADLFDAGLYVEATRILQQQVDKNPGDAQANLWLARCYLELGNVDQAIAHAQQAVKLDPDSCRYHLWLGRAYGRKAEERHSFPIAKNVRREFEKAVQLDPANLPARRDLMEFYLEAPWILGGSKDKAWEQARAISSHDARAGHLAKGAFWQGTHQEDRAEGEYQQVLDSKAEGIEPYFEVSEFYESRRDAPHMDAANEAASRINPNDPRLAYYRGVAWVLEAQNLPEAEKSLKTYLLRAPSRSDYPSHAAAEEWLGRLYELQGKAPEAAEHYRAALQLDPKRPRAREALSRLRSSR
jgi:tetratricopeptide (TPR) repeat protein